MHTDELFGDDIDQAAGNDDRLDDVLPRKRSCSGIAARSGDRILIEIGGNGDARLHLAVDLDGKLDLVFLGKLEVERGPCLGMDGRLPMAQNRGPQLLGPMTVSYTHLTLPTKLEV